MFIHLLAINFMNVEQVPSKTGFRFELSIALGTRKAGLTSAFVFHVSVKGALLRVRPFTLATLEWTVLGTCVFGAFL